jgi:hypothetical protein
VKILSSEIKVLGSSCCHFELGESSSRSCDDFELGELSDFVNLCFDLELQNLSFKLLC